MTEELWDEVRRLAVRLDETGALAPEQRTLLQILKIGEEFGEAAEAVIGAQGANPRKGHSHTWADVERELYDVLVTTMVALLRLNPAPAKPFEEHLKRAVRRTLGEAG
ncbi:hypothetical protein CFP65_2088 [Kitasatospora sp. MMS16-BH015]|uniref:MazG-like family protein n=1 Tax=Kitasatospora sp. MMS16-BH015 TaxID=2018025 RepID=UPI000CA32B79|nr:MazG-like family protein [Kitasatospora sp. MMS16-BH015]AUG76946.1 hypothetical protein CFP65_2088 [Kitasatospora sp. MMS16-BH015]